MVYENWGSSGFWKQPFLVSNNIVKHINIVAPPAMCVKPNASLPTTSLQISTSISATAVVTVVKQTAAAATAVAAFFNNFGFKPGFIHHQLLSKPLLLELLSADLDPATGLQKRTIKSYARKRETVNEEIKYETHFVIPADFGPIGAIFIQNDHYSELYLKDILIHGIPTGPLHFSCNSWIHSRFQNDDNRVFFTAESYLPSKTPEGLKRLREDELRNLQGNGQGEREIHHRIYDYDVYNDLGNPDKGHDFKRPVLGGKQFPYPRRCRTGRPRSQADPLSEARSSKVSVPRDEAFSETKKATFLAKQLGLQLHAMLVALEKLMSDIKLSCPHFTIVGDLFNNGIRLPPSQGDKFFWFRDDEFARQILTGLNPCCIKLVREWPLKSKLDPAIYGSSESAITNEIIQKQVKGFTTVDEAIEQKKLFILDYHDLLLSYAAKVRKLKDRTLYGSRTLFFLTPDNILRPLAIELTRPPIDGQPQWKEVFTPSWDATGLWLWRIAKAHVLAHDCGYHQLVSHWLRTHCCVEPYIISTHRQLSAMHPIYRLLHPHFRYTIVINAIAREALINGDGIIETTFSLGKYSMEFSSVVYDKLWQFNLEALPADLIHRGLAVEDSNAPHGLKLTIEDYPFANDGLFLWDALKQWATDYVNHYYPDPSLVESDDELQEWWTEIRIVGHGDKKDELWWPVLNTPQDLIDIVTTIMWVTSGLHAAVNFGQCSYAGYFPNKPTIARINMPTEEPNPELWQSFLEKPEKVLLDTFPTQIQSATVMVVLNLLSSHSPDEEYLGQKIQPAWASDPIIKRAFERFSVKLKELERIIDERNANTKLKNRNGAGVMPYQIMKPDSEPGITGRGVPCSVSI